MKPLFAVLGIAFGIASPHFCHAAPTSPTRSAASARAVSPAKTRERIARAKLAEAKLTQASVRRHIEVLAGDRARGRGSATNAEFESARFIATEMGRYGIKPAGQNRTFFQRVALDSVVPAPRSRDFGRGRITTNVVGVLPGSDPKLRKQVVLLSAHLDHLGVGPGVNGDTIYNGADDDASGVAAVLELARVLSRGPRPRRTVVFALFGSEEIGGYGANYFREHPPLPLENMVANLEFEMIGRPDAAIPPRCLWMAGYERSDLGAALAAHGAPIVPDPHPEQGFFRRSDNYVLARRGVIAHTVSSFGLHPEYHQPSDDIAHLDFAHLTQAIQAMIVPVQWLCNSGFKPRWNPGQQP